MEKFNFNITANKYDADFALGKSPNAQSVHIGDGRYLVTFTVWMCEGESLFDVVTKTIDNTHFSDYEVFSVTDSKGNTLFDETTFESAKAMNERVDSEVRKIYSVIGIDMPSNHNNIVLYCLNDIRETADLDNWHSGDVSIAFRRLLETLEFD